MYFIPEFSFLSPINLLPKDCLFELTRLKFRRGAGRIFSRHLVSEIFLFTVCLLTSVF